MSLHRVSIPSRVWSVFLLVGTHTWESEGSSLNPFQGLVGVSIDSKGNIQSLSLEVSIPFRVWSVFLWTRRVLAMMTGYTSQSLSGFGRCFYIDQSGLSLRYISVSIPFRVWSVFLLTRSLHRFARLRCLNPFQGSVNERRLRSAPVTDQDKAPTSSKL